MITDTENYLWDAKEYAKHSQNQYEWALELIPKLNLKGNEVLLDIGCGDGRVSATLASYLPNGRVVGVDSSEEMISQARKTYPNCRFPNLSFLKMDARELTFREQFDVAFSNATLHWIIDHQAVLAGVKESLVKNGKLLFQMGGKGNGQEIISVLQEMISEDTCEPYLKNFSFPYAFYDQEQYKIWLRESGFKPERVELIQKEMKLDGKEGLAGWIHTTWLPLTERIPANLREQCVNKIAERYVEAYPMDENGIVHVKMARLEVQATKL